MSVELAANLESASAAHEPVADQESSKKEEEDVRLLNPYIDFECGICHMKEKSLFGDLKCTDGFYPSPVFFLRDPFAPPVRVKTRKPVLGDFLVFGSACSLCDQPICLDKACSIYFGNHFCVNCIAREQRRFPTAVHKMVAKAQQAPPAASASETPSEKPQTDKR